MTDYRAELLSAALRELMRRTGAGAHVSARPRGVRVFAMVGRNAGWVHDRTYSVRSIFGLRQALRDLRAAEVFAREWDRKEHACD